MAKKRKYYVVWDGHEPGVYDTWDEAKAQIQNYSSAKYKSFSTLAEAEHAYDRHWGEYYSEGKSKAPKNRETVAGFRAIPDEVIADSIAVDAACSGNPGKMEYRGVITLTGQELFHSPIFPVGTNNIGEFLAIVHALALYHEKKPGLTIYTDSRIAMGWIKAKKARTKLVKNPTTAKLWQLVARGENWLKTHKWKNPIVKWETKQWGEIPADFGRK